jgi:hypothetical protein
MKNMKPVKLMKKSLPTVFFMVFTGFMSFMAREAFAQSAPSPKWEVEVHAGRVVVVNPLEGFAPIVPLSQPFSTGPGRVTRPVSSWYFGEGAQLFNLVATQLGTPSSMRLTSMNAVVAQPVLLQKSGMNAGVRLSRSIKRLVRIEGSVEFRGGTAEVSPAALNAIEATRASFVTAWQRFLSDGALQNPAVSSVADIRSGNSGQIVATGALNFAFKATGKNIPYVIGGAGVLISTGDTPVVTMTGRYTAKSGAGTIDETDTLVTRYPFDKYLVVGLVGVGWKHFMSPRWGVRADLREHLSGNRIRNAVDANPVSVLTSSSAEAVVFSRGGFETIQISNVSSSRSSLSGPALQNFRTFTSTGMESRFTMTAGFFLRF